MTAGVEFIPADDEKGPRAATEAQGEREAGQAGREARQISLSGAPASVVLTNSRARLRSAGLSLGHHNHMRDWLDFDLGKSANRAP